MHRLICLGALFLANAALAGPVENHFSAGVLGVKWGAPLSEVQSRFPDGYTWETVKLFGTEFAYETHVEASLFGLDAQNLLVHFTFGKGENLIGAHLFYRYSRKDDVLYQIAETLGQNYLTSIDKRESHFEWRSDARLRVVLSIGHRPPHEWTVLSIYSKDPQVR